MSKKTLLRVVQDYLTYVGGFQVDSIFDSEESTQAAQIAEHVFYSIVDKNRDLMCTTVVRSLDPSADISLPCVLTIPSEIRRIHSSEIWYNEHKTGGVQFKRVKFIDPVEFLKFSEGITTNAENTAVQYVNGVPFVITTNKSPDYCTTFDDKVLVFDSYDSSVDDTLQESKTKVISTQSPVFLLQDDFIIPFPDRMISGYTDLVINECAVALRSVGNPNVARRANQFTAKLQQTQKAIGSKMPTKQKYGRR
jgi:hypothetical protein